MSFKTLKRGGELVIDKNGKVTKNTLKDSEVRTLYGGTSVLTSYAAKAQAGSMLPKSYRAFSGSALAEVITSAVGAFVTVSVPLLKVTA